MKASFATSKKLHNDHIGRNEFLIGKTPYFCEKVKSEN